MYTRCYYLPNAHWKLNGRFLHSLMRFCLYRCLLLTFHQIFSFVHPNIILPLFLPSSPLCFRQIFFKTCCSWKTTTKNIRHDIYFSTQCLCLSSAYVRNWQNVPLTFLCQGCCWTVASPLLLLAKKKICSLQSTMSVKGLTLLFIYTYVEDKCHFEISVQRQAQPTYTFCGFPQSLTGIPWTRQWTLPSSFFQSHYSL